MSNKDITFRANASNNSLYDSIVEEVENTISQTSAGTMSDGTVSNPGLEFELDPDLGFYRIGNNNLGISCGGIKAVDITDSLTAFSGDVDIKTGRLELREGTFAEPCLQIGTSTQTGIYATNTLVDPTVHIKVLGSSDFEFNTEYFIVKNEIRNENGSNTNPTYTFTDATNTGMYRNGAGDIGFTRNGTAKALFGSASTVYFNVAENPDGSASAPAYSFNSDDDSGLYRIADNNVGISCGNKNVFDIQQSNSTITTSEFVHRPLSVLSTTNDFRIQVGDGLSSYDDLFHVDETLTRSYVDIQVPLSGQIQNGGGENIVFNSINETVAMQTAGISRFTVDTGNITTTIPIYAANGSAAAPSYAFSNNPDVGMFYNPTNVSLDFSVNSGSYVSCTNNETVDSLTNVSGLAIRPPADKKGFVMYQADTSYTENLFYFEVETTAGTGFNFGSMSAVNVRQFKFRGDGTLFANNATISTPADYAEMFESKESLDIGDTVVLDGEYVRKALDTDNVDDIIGVVRPKDPTEGASFITNSFDNNWVGRYKRGNYGNYEIEEVLDDNGNPVLDDEGYATYRRVDNPAFDNTQKYIPRRLRDEWYAIGLVGQVYVNSGSPVNSRWKLMKNGGQVNKYFIH